MDNKARLEKLGEGKYKELFGVKKETFDKMLEILEERHREEHAKGGRPSKLSVTDKLVIMLGYYREYRAMEHIAFDYSVAKSTICESIRWAEKALVKSGAFSLPAKRKVENDETIEVIIVDATETEVERPKKNSGSIIQEKRKGTR